MLKIKKVKPMFNTLITTMDKYNENTFTAGGLIDVKKQEGSLKEYQKVLAVGTSVRDIKEGDLVWINPTRFGIKKHQEGSLKDGVITDNPIISYNFDVIEMDGNNCLLLQDRDIDFIIEDFEVIKDVESKIIVPEKKILC